LNFNQKFLAVFVLAVILGSGLLVSTRPATSAKSLGYQQSGTLNLAMPNCIDSFSQFTTECYQPWYFLQTMFPDNGVPTALGLIHIAVQSYTSNSNGTVWYFTVTPNMTWSDGVPANATDLAWSIQQMFANYSWGAGSMLSYASLLNGTAQQAIHADNASVVEIDLNSPFSLLGDIIGGENTPNFTPEHIWNSLINGSTAPGSMFGTLVGVGPYYVSNFAQGDQQLVMLPNPYSTPWGDPANGGHPYFSQIVTTLVPSSASLADLLLSGQIDAAPVGPSDVAGLLTNPNIKVSETPGTGLWYLEFTNENYPYNMTGFRQALLYAIDRNGLVQSALAGYGVPGNTAFIPSSSPDFNSSVPEYNYNVTIARQILQSLGFVNGSNGFYNLPNGSAFEPNVYVPSEQTPIVLAGTLVVQDLQAAGIDAQLRTIAGAEMPSVWYQGWNMYFDEQNFGYPNTELLTDQSFYSSYAATGPSQGQVTFVTPASAAAYNSSVVALESATNSSQILSDEMHIESVIANYLPSIPLFYPDFIWAYNSQKIADWPTAPSSFELPGAVFNMTALSYIRPTSMVNVTSTSSSSSTSSPTSSMSSTTSSSSSSVSSSSTSSPSVSSSSTSPPSVSVTTVTSTATTSGASTTAIAAVGIVVVIVIIGAVAVLMRRRPKT
jgi:peptide/nickel transport system substrate-binding protein